MMFGLARGGAKWIVAFLGNPGAKYENTRHNAGFLAAEFAEKNRNIRINRARFQALTALTELGGEKALLMKPQTYMNLSGEAVGEAARFYKIPPERVIVISDDVALPMGAIRVRRGGSAGGHNGLKSIIAHLGTEGFPRIRIGVGAPAHEDYDMIDWVIGKLPPKDRDLVLASAENAFKAAEIYIRDGADKAMNDYN